MIGVAFGAIFSAERRLAQAMTEHATPPPQPPLLSRLPFEVEAPEKGDFADASPLSEAEQADVMRRVCWRLLPVCWFSALLSYLDRRDSRVATPQSSLTSSNTAGATRATRRCRRVALVP